MINHNHPSPPKDVLRTHDPNDVTSDKEAIAFGRWAQVETEKDYKASKQPKKREKSWKTFFPKKHIYTLLGQLEDFIEEDIKSPTPPSNANKPLLEFQRLEQEVVQFDSQVIMPIVSNIMEGKKASNLSLIPMEIQKNVKRTIK